MARRCAAAAAVLMAMLVACAAQRRFIDTRGIPRECIRTSLSLQNACSKELELASKAFGVSPNADISQIKVDQKQIDDYLAKAPAPSDQCCSAAMPFNSAYCNCSPSVLELVKSYTGGDVSEYKKVARWMATKCGDVGKSFTLYMDDTCPKSKSGSK